MSSMVPCAPSNRIDSPLVSAWFSRTAVSQTKGAIFSAACAYSVYILSASRGSELNSACAIMFFSRTAFSMCFLSNCRSSRSATRKPAAAHFVFVGGTDAAGGGANLDSSRRVLGRQFNHAMVGQDHVGAVGNEEVAVDLHPGLAQGARLFQKGQGIEHHAVADHAAASGAQHAAGHELENKFLAVNDDGVAGVVSAGIAGHDREVLRQNVDDLPFALIAPLGAYDHRSLAFFQFQLRQGNFKQADVCAAPGVAHSLPAAMPSQKITGIRAEKTCTDYLIVSMRRIATRRAGRGQGRGLTSASASSLRIPLGGLRQKILTAEHAKDSQRPQRRSTEEIQNSTTQQAGP